MSNKMSTDFSVHPSAAIFPMMTEERLAELVEDIKVHGLTKPIEVYKNQVIDGRNRLEACKRAGITPHYKDVTSEVEDPIAYVASVNLKRRDLTESQRAIIIAELATLPVGANQHRKEPVSRETPSPTLAKVAKGAGVSRATLARAKAVKKAAPALAEKVKAGTTTVNSAYKQVKAAKEGSKPAPTPAATPKPVLRCSFCGKDRHQVRILIAGPSVCVCNECVDLCNNAIASRRKQDDVVRGTVRRTVEAITKNFNEHDVEIIAKQLTEHTERWHAENREAFAKSKLSLVTAKSDAQEGAGAAITTPPATSVSPESSPAVQPPT